MRYFLQLSILLAVLGTSAAFGADRIRLAQSSQTAPALPPPQLLPQATAAGTCAITCNSAAMNCLNTCVGPRPRLAGQPAVQPELHHATAHLQAAVLDDPDLHPAGSMRTSRQRRVRRASLRSRTAASAEGASAAAITCARCHGGGKTPAQTNLV